MGIISNTRARKLQLKKLLEQKRFRVSIFGSARTKRGDKVYRKVFNLAKFIGEAGYDLVTGGGPGLMEAANAGHEFGDVDNKAESIGLVIELPFEASSNQFLEISKSFKRFSKRLDTFLELSNVMVVTQGGIGTILELYYMWQHIQVKHVGYHPLILMGPMWESLIAWMKVNTLKPGLVSAKDFDCIYVVKDEKEAIEVLNLFEIQWRKTGKMKPINCKQSRAVKARKKAK